LKSLQGRLGGGVALIDSTIDFWASQDFIQCSTFSDNSLIHSVKPTPREPSMCFVYFLNNTHAIRQAIAEQASTQAMPDHQHKKAKVCIARNDPSC
jgi:hypothetical protein